MTAEPLLHVEAEGSGPTVARAHGFGSSARNFLPQARALRAHWRIVRYDARGYARSEAPGDPAAYTPEAFVADLGRVLDQVGAELAVVGGLSMDAGIALRFALAHPERVRGLVLAAFPAGRDAPGSFSAVADGLLTASSVKGSSAPATGSSGVRRRGSTQPPPRSSAADSANIRRMASRTRCAG